MPEAPGCANSQSSSTRRVVAVGPSQHKAVGSGCDDLAGSSPVEGHQRRCSIEHQFPECRLKHARSTAGDSTRRGPRYERYAENGIDASGRGHLQLGTRGTPGRGETSPVRRRRWKSPADFAANQPVAEVMAQSIIFADRNEIDSSSFELVRRTGIVHWSSRPRSQIEKPLLSHFIFNESRWLVVSAGSDAGTVIAGLDEIDTDRGELPRTLAGRVTVNAVNQPWSATRRRCDRCSRRWTPGGGRPVAQHAADAGMDGLRQKRQSRRSQLARIPAKRVQDSVMQQCRFRRRRLGRMIEIRLVPSWRKRWQRRAVRLSPTPGSVLRRVRATPGQSFASGIKGRGACFVKIVHSAWARFCR